MKQYFGNYLGVVVNTQDPEQRGRVQIFVPGLTPSLYQNWDSRKQNISFKTLESDTFTDEVLIRLYTHLPWAEAAVPFWGGNTGAPINDDTGVPTPIPTDQGFTVPSDATGGGRVLDKNNSRGRTAYISPQLEATIERGLAGTGVHWISQSGQGGSTVAGSYHSDGSATDGVFVDAKTGNTLNPNNPEDKNKIAYALWSLTRAGIGGIGWDGSVSAGGTGVRYMEDDVFHLDIGPLRNWGSKRNGRYGSGTAAQWVLDARSGRGFQQIAGDSGPPIQAYAEPRKPSVDGIALTSGDFNGQTIKIGSGLSDTAINAVRNGMGLSSNQLANNAAIAYRTAYNESIARGATSQQASIVASAIVGNIARESGFRTGLSHDGGIGYGLLGENQDILQRMLQYASTKGESRQTGISVQTQIEALFREPYFIGDRARNGGFDGLKNSVDVSSAAELFAKGYLLPSARTANYQERINNAIAANQTFSGLGAGELVTAVEGQNVLRTRVPDAYGSIDGSRTGAAMGFTSIPYMGSKVWVFFIGGDVQRPVYFASVYEPNNIV